MQIQLKSCSKSYNYQKIINALSETIVSGSKTAVLGNNGSGKSTLSLMIAGQIEPNEGGIEWMHNGKLIDVSQIHEHISLSSPALVLPEEFTISELLDFHTNFKELSEGLNTDKLIELCGFDESIRNKPIKNFSSGMKQRIKLCLAIFTKSNLLILDEPTENLDSDGIALYNQLLTNIPKERTVMIATNRKSDYEICDTFIRL